MSRGSSSEPASSALRPGVVLDDKYEILTLLGAGGMGEVYKARHIHLNALRCVKVMKSGLMGGSAYRARFLREARLATQIHHRNLALVHDFASLADGSDYMVTEYIDGTTVRQWSAVHGPFPLPLAIEVTMQVLAGLDHIHRRGLLHRDISSDNIMLAYDDEERLVVKIIDLGVAKDVTASSTDTTQTGMLVGNPKYMSPEQLGELAEGEQLDGRTDLYSLGIVLYEMLLGLPPFVSRTPSGYIVKHLTEPPPPFRDARPGQIWPEGLEAVAMRALEKDRRRRYADARVFTSALQPFAARPIGTMTRVDIAAFGEEDDTIVQTSPGHAVTQVEQSEGEAFQRAWESGSSEAWRGFLARHPASGQAARARDLLEEAEAFEQAKTSDSETALREFLGLWPEGRHRVDAEIELATVTERLAESAFASAVAADTYAAFRDFLAKFGSAKRADQARRALAERLAFETAAALDLEDAWDEYLTNFSGDPHAEAARERLEAARVREEEAFAAAAAAKTARGWDEFLAQFPLGKRSGWADLCRREALAFEEARKHGREGLEQYLRVYANGLLVNEARAIVRQLADDEDFAHARSLDNPAALRLYLTTHPSGTHRDEASARLIEIEDAAFAAVLTAKDVRRARDFLAQFPDSPRRAELDRLIVRWEESEAVRAALDALERGDSQQAEDLLPRLSDTDVRSQLETALDAWRDAKSWKEVERAKSAVALQAYLQSWPEGRWAREAKRRLSRLRISAASREERDWQQAWERGTAAGWDEYLALHPESPRTAEAARCRREATEYELAMTLNTPTMWRAFIKAWPNGRHRLDAEVRMRGSN